MLNETAEKGLRLYKKHQEANGDPFYNLIMIQAVEMNFDPKEIQVKITVDRLAELARKLVKPVFYIAEPEGIYGKVNHSIYAIRYEGTWIVAYQAIKGAK
ncbi:MAG: hypothetical protein PHH85_03475 [Candidatus Methanoperedens sp.]|nr:hypothetical protein [Candidatus Methanoperedens sp.]